MRFGTKSLSVCSKASVPRPLFFRTLSAGQSNGMISIGSQKGSILAGWTGHTTPLLSLLSSLHKVN